MTEPLPSRMYRGSGRNPGKMKPKAARIRARKTQAEAAVETGIGLDTIRKIEQRTERGEMVRIARRTWERLCHAYAVSELEAVELRT